MLALFGYPDGDGRSGMDFGVHPIASVHQGRAATYPAGNHSQRNLRLRAFLERVVRSSGPDHCRSGIHSPFWAHRDVARQRCCGLTAEWKLPQLARSGSVVFLRLLRQSPKTAQPHLPHATKSWARCATTFSPATIQLPRVRRPTVLAWAGLVNHELHDRRRA